MNVKYCSYLLLVFLVLFGSASAQEPEIALDPVKARENIKVRLDEIVKFQIERDYESAYGLIKFEADLTLDEFVKGERSSDLYGRPILIGFQLVEIGLFEPLYRDAIIFGCGEYLSNGERIYDESKIVARFRNNDWHFASLITPVWFKQRECIPRVK
jgi:hypothetical protein